MSQSVINQVVESVAGLIDGLNLYSTVTRGAIGTGNGIACEVVPANVESVFMDKGYYLPLPLAINGKHSNLQTVSDALNNIVDSLSRITSYPSGENWEIVDITAGGEPHLIGREENNLWLMNCDVIIKIYRKEASN